MPAPHLWTTPRCGSESWDANRAKHGIDFVSAQRLWSDPDRLKIPARPGDEPQWASLDDLSAACGRGHYVETTSGTPRFVSRREGRQRGVRREYRPVPGQERRSRTLLAWHALLGILARTLDLGLRGSAGEVAVLQFQHHESGLKGHGAVVLLMNDEVLIWTPQGESSAGVRREDSNGHSGVPSATLRSMGTALLGPVGSRLRCSGERSMRASGRGVPGVGQWPTQHRSRPTQRLGSRVT